MATPFLTPYPPSRAVEAFKPASPFLSFYRQANRMFEDVFREFDEAREAFGGILSPTIDVTQTDQEIRISAELPGVKDEDVEVTAENDVLTIRAEKRVERDEARDKRYVAERSYGTFQRSLRMPQAIDPQQVRANFDHGILTIRLPRAEQENGRRQIAVESGPPQERKGEIPSESRH
ncbi:MAG TPA: Hsp20/alpha crystallin family protein [Sphingobium sp.]|nr:Hsp20/alpha crystallin family protein [Sphingobium sp.]